MNRTSLRALVLARASVAAAILLVTGVVCAQVYRSVLPDGRVVYSDRPPPNAAKTDEVDLPSPPTPEQRQEAAAVEAAIEQASQTSEGAGREAAAEAADAEVRAAEKELAAARKRLDEGRVEREGDRIGKVGGGARLSDAYWQRIGSLERDVKNAEERLKAARQAKR